MKRYLIPILFLFIFFGCKDYTVDQEVSNAMTNTDKELRIATFAGGCFWCTESDFEKLPGVVKVISGYTGGHKENPTYKEVCSDRTGHAESYTGRT